VLSSLFFRHIIDTLNSASRVDDDKYLGADESWALMNCLWILEINKACIWDRFSFSTKFEVRGRSWGKRDGSLRVVCLVEMVEYETEVFVGIKKVLKSFSIELHVQFDLFRVVRMTKGKYKWSKYCCTSLIMEPIASLSKSCLLNQRTSRSFSMIEWTQKLCHAFPAEFLARDYPRVCIMFWNFRSFKIIIS
jgi:hypothetical protein